MSNKKDIIDKTKPLHLYLAMRRSKDNIGQTQKDELCFREFDRGDGYSSLLTRVQKYTGVWRIYKTVNARDTIKATKLLQHMLLDEFDNWHYRVDSLYKKCLLQRACRKEKNFLVDIDTKDQIIVAETKKILHDKILFVNETPNGWHLITTPFNPKEYSFDKRVEINPDGYIFVHKVDVRNNSTINE